MPTSTADVATASAPRYAKQLVSHLGHRADAVLEEPEGPRIVIGAGSCLLVAGDSLVLRATGEDAEALDRVKAIVGSHLERFGAKSELVVSWT